MLKNQNAQKGQTFKTIDENDSETMTDTMDTDEHPKYFLSESDSEESDTDVANDVEDSITDL